MKKAPRVLVVDDDENIQFAFKEVLRKDGCVYFAAWNGEEAIEQLHRRQPDIIFMDITMPKLDGLETLKQIREVNQKIPIVIITGYGTMQTAVKAMKLGAFEYFTKPLDVEKIREIKRKALASIVDQSIPSVDDQWIKAEIGDRYQLVGRNVRIQEIYKLIGSISTTPTHTSVLIIGESGTGKELVARAIHNNASNAREPFVGINCTVLPDTLLESELFGYEKGSFTGANERKIGKFEVAGKGTIFLDEIGNLSPQLQQKLLRVLQEREFERLGGNIPIHVEARFITATNQDIEKNVKKGIFREDLFYRLNVVMIHLPPLRDRKDDIPLLANYFLSKYNGHLKKNVKSFSDDTMALLETYSYPGNVRELENLIERAVMLTMGEVILPHTLKDVLTANISGTQDISIVSPIFGKSRKHILKIFEKQFLITQLTKHRGNVTAAAFSSKMSRQNFQRLMQKHKIFAEQFRT
ncbi:MAG: sigma-54 dependent transcriptional regulator [Bacteroidota bacterium]|nr:sigma-54 dependent transcriptional regulator [Bacteroidota bacterium]